jgi:hypothetical protein
MALTATSTDHRGLNLVGFQGAGKLSRADFGLRWNAMLETGGVLVGDEVDLTFDIALIRQTAARQNRPKHAAVSTPPRDEAAL